MQVKVEANKPQARFLGLDNKFRSFVGGVGSGKTWVGTMAQCIGFFENPRINQGYFGPTYPHIRDIFFPTAEEVAHAFGLRVKIRQGDKEVHFYNGRTYIGTTICRSMDRPDKIIGFKIGRALCDELDILPTPKARTAWRKIIARMRYDNAPNSVDVTTTPEGFKYVYDQFKKKQSPMYGLVQASTYDNAANLPEDYIPSLLETYPEVLVQAYLHGEFVNLTSGTVYSSFDRDTCHSDRVVEDGDELHIGIDFNVNNMTGIVFINEGNGTIAVDEFTGLSDTPALIAAVKARYGKHRIVAYPDASGGNRTTINAQSSDIQLLRMAGWQVRVLPSNPYVRDRVVCVNVRFGDGTLAVNAGKCPVLVEALERQAYTPAGEPDKTQGYDHPPDALGYRVFYSFPLRTGRGSNIYAR